MRRDNQINPVAVCAGMAFAAGGHMSGGVEGIAPLADKMLAEQLGRLKAYIEKR